MRAGRVEEAGALAERIGKDMKRQINNRLKTINGKTDVKDMWAAVRQLTGRKQETGRWTCCRYHRRVAKQPLRRYIYRQSLHASSH